MIAVFPAAIGLCFCSFHRTTNNTITSDVRANAGYNSCNSKTTYRVVRLVRIELDDSTIKSRMPYHLATVAYKSRLTHPRELASSPIIRVAIIIVTTPKRLILCSAQFKNHLLGGPGWSRTNDVSNVRVLQTPAIATMHTSPYNDHRGMSPVIFVLALTGQTSGIYRFL